MVYATIILFKNTYYDMLVSISLVLLILFVCLYSLLPAKMCWEMMIRVIKGPQSMMMFKKGRGNVAAG